MGAALDQWNSRKKQNPSSTAIRKGSALEAWNSGRADRMSQSINRLDSDMQSLQKQTAARKSYWDGNDQQIRQQADDLSRRMQQIEADAKRYNMKNAYNTDALEQYKKYSASVLSALDADARLYGQFKTEDEYNNAVKAYAEQKKKQAENDAEAARIGKMSLEELDKELARIESEQKKYKKANGGEASNTIWKIGTYLQDPMSANSTARNIAQDNIDTLKSYERQKQQLMQARYTKLLEPLSEDTLAAVDEVIDARKELKNYDWTAEQEQRNEPSYKVAYENKGKNTAQDVSRKEQKAVEYLKRQGYSNVDELVDARVRQKNAEQAKTTQETMRKAAQEMPVASNAIATLAQFERGVSAVEDVGRLLTGKRLDVNSEAHIPGMVADTVRGTTQEMIEENADTAAGKVAGRVAYNVGMGIVDNLARMGFGMATGGAAYASTISGAIMGSQVMSQAVVEGKQKGYSDEKAVGMAMVQAAIEAATERWSVETVLKDSKSVFRQVAKSFVAEGTEEVTSNVANYIADALANGNENELHKAYDRYRLQGKSDKDALKAVIWDVVGENAEAFLVGGLSGGVLGAGSAVMYDQRRAAYGKAVIESGAVNEMLDDAEGRDDRELQKYVDKVKKNKENPSARAVGNAMLRLAELSEDGADKQAIIRKYTSGKRLTAEDREAVRNDPEIRHALEEQGIEPERRAMQVGDLGDEALMSYAEEYKDTGAEQSFKDNYRAGQNVDAYAAGYNAVWQAGVDGDSFEAVEAMFQGVWLDDFTREQAIEAHRAGYMEGMAAVSEPFAQMQVENNGEDVIRSAEMKNGVTLVNVQKRLNPTMRTQLAVLQNFGKEKGISFAIVDDYSRRYVNMNGAQLGGTNKIIINLDAEGGMLLRTAGHEVFHYLEQVNADAAKKLRDFVVDHYVKEGKYESLAQQYAAQGYEGNIDGELTADNLFDVMTQEGFLQRYAAEDANTVRTLRNTVAAFIRHINNALHKLTMTNPIHREIYDSLNKDKQFFEKLRKMATDALDSLPSAQSNHSAVKSETKRSESVKYSQKYGKESEDYKKPITIKDIIMLRSSGRKSVNAFLSEDIKKAQKWAYLYQHEFKEEDRTKSPFFRAWFGEWRAYDKSRIVVVDIPRYAKTKEESIERKPATNKDTGWTIRVSRQGESNTVSHSGKEKRSVYGLSNINGLIENAVLLNTEVHDVHNTRKNDYVAFDHKLYALGRSDGTISLYRITIEERFQDHRHTNDRLFHNLKYIEKIADVPAGANVEQSHKDRSTMGSSTINYTVAHLYDFVKRFDKEFPVGRLVDEKLLNADGTPKVMYRGGTETINIFDRKKSRASNLYGRGFYFTEDKNAAALYGDVKEYFLRIEHPLMPGKHTLKKEQFRRFLSAIENGYDEDWDLYNYGENYSIDALADSLAKKGDFEALQDISATAVGDLVACIEAFNKINGTKYDGIILPTETVVFDSTQIKSATDNIGTFDQNNPDIRYSLKPASSISEENRRLIEENERYKALIQKLNGQIHALQKKVVDPKGVRKLARDVRAEYQSKIDQAELEQKLTGLFDYIANEQDIDFGEITRVAAEIAKDVISQSDALNTELTEQYADLRDYLKTTRLQLTSLQKSEMAVQFDSYENFRRKNFGKIRFTKDGIKLDELWGELSDTWPEFFKADEHEAEMPLRLMDAIEATNPFHENPYGMNMDEAAYDLALRIYDAYYDIPEVAGLQRQINDMRAEYKEKYKKALQKTRTEYEGKLAEQVARLERRGAAETRRRAVSQVLQSANALAKKLAANSAKKNVPDVLKGPVMGMLDTISAYSESGRVTELNRSFFENLRKAHERLTDLYKDGSDDALESVYSENLDLTEDFMEQMRRIRRDVDELLEVYGKEDRHVLQMMNLDQLDVLNRVLVQMHHMVTKAGELHQNELYRNANDLARDTIRELSEMEERKAHKLQIGDTMEKFLGWTNATPYYVFKRFGTAGLSIFNEMQTGFDDFAFRVRDVRDYALSAYTAKEVQAWEKEVHTFTDKDGNKFRLTTPQVMSIYCLSWRDAARRHLLGGGITPGQVGEYQQSQRYKLDEKTLNDMIDVLSDRQKEVADKLQRFLSTTCADWGNSISMKRFGIRIFTEKFYFPMAVDQNTVKLGDTPKMGNGLFDLINRSFTKELNDKASNALYAQNIFDVFTAHAIDMAQYNALALPVLDMMKWYNGTVSSGEQTGDVESSDKQNVRAELERVFGKQAQEYIDQFVRDINGTTSEDRMRIGKKIMRNFKVAKVAANLNVALVQPTAYVRAANVLDPKYLASALSGIRNLPTHIKEMQQYSGIGLWKSMGFFDVDVNRSLSTMIKYGDTTVDKIREAGMKGAEVADNMTWGLIWYACQKWAYKEKGLPFGNKACNEAAAEKFREIVYASQVVDSPMTRSALMRSKNGLDQAASAFMSEPTLSYNMLMDQVFVWQKDARSGLSAKDNLKKNGKTIARAAATYCMTAVFAAAVEAISGALRDDDDDEFGEKYLDSFLDNLFSDLSIVQKVPGIKYLAEVAQAVLEGKSFSDSNPYTQTFKEFTSAVSALRSGNIYEYKTIYKLLTFLSGASGLPVSNLTREVVAMWNATVGAAMPEYKLRRYNVSQKQKIMQYADGDDIRGQTQKLLQDKVDAKRKEDPDANEHDLEKDARSGLKSSITSAAKEIYKDGDPDKAQRLMQQSGLYNAKDVREKLDGWSKE